MKKISVGSIRRRTMCYMCQGTGIEYHQYEAKFHRSCGVCNGAKYTKFRLNFKYYNLELEAMICNSHGAINKNKWCVEVFTNEKITDKNKDDFSGLYEVGSYIGVHHYLFDGWGKSINVAYKNAIRNIEKNFVFNTHTQEFELKKN